MATVEGRRDDPAGLDVIEADGGARLKLSGDWTVHEIGRFERAVMKAASGPVVIDLSGLGHLDTAGAWLLGQATAASDDPDGDACFEGEHPYARRLIKEVRKRMAVCEGEAKRDGGVVAVFARIGRGVIGFRDETVDTFAFLGRTLTTAASTAVRPRRLRWTATVSTMESAGVNALPIIAILSFFIGAVVAFMGANLLETFGASVFTVELVGIAVLREFGVLITAIMLAGRSNSAFTAAIGSMKMQQEIDAMKVIGIDPFEALVLPRVIACVVMAPLLTLAAMLAGIFGGMMVSWATLDISPAFFIQRLQAAIDWSQFFVGMSKAPVFGLVIAVIGCRQGMKVKGDVESLGQRTTASVVQAIFAVIVIDAIFAMVYLELDI
jgi:phospholipid/cholesterol/gamma-HCH transport system permease protein